MRLSNVWTALVTLGSTAALAGLLGACAQAPTAPDAPFHRPAGAGAFAASTLGDPVAQVRASPW